MRRRGRRPGRGFIVFVGIGAVVAQGSTCTAGGSSPYRELSPVLPGPEHQAQDMRSQVLSAPCDERINRHAGQGLSLPVRGAPHLRTVNVNRVESRTQLARPVPRRDARRQSGRTRFPQFGESPEAARRNSCYAGDPTCRSCCSRCSRRGRALAPRARPAIDPDGGSQLCRPGSGPAPGVHGDRARGASRGAGPARVGAAAPGSPRASDYPEIMAARAFLARVDRCHDFAWAPHEAGVYCSVPWPTR